MTTLTGGPGNDVINEVLGDGLTAVDGAGGVNTLNADWSAAGGDVSANLSGGSGDIGEASTGDALHMDNIQNLNITTGSGDDFVSVASGDNVLNGGSGDDWLSGGSGTNIINGGAGFDLAVSNGGVDTVDGGGDINVWDGFYEGTAASLTFTQTGERSYVMSNGTTLQNIDGIYAYGGGGDDTFNLTGLGGSLAGLTKGGWVSGSGGDNTLNLDLSATSDAVTTGTNVAGDPQAFADGFVSDPTSGMTLNYFQIAHLNLYAGSGDDTFAFNVLLGWVDGGDGVNALSVDQSAVSDALSVNFQDDTFNQGGGGVADATTGRSLDFAHIQTLTLVTGSGDDTFHVDSHGFNLAKGFSFDGGGGANTFTADLSSMSQVDFALNDAPGAVSAFGFPLNPGPAATLTNIQTLDLTTGLGADHLSGGGGADTIAGATGDNRIAGGGGNDVLSGSGVLYGDAGNDTLTALPDAVRYAPTVLMQGGTGDDVLNGLGGNATPGGPYPGSAAIYADMDGHIGATSGVTVDLNLTGPQNTGGAGVDTLVDVLGAVGTRWDDVLNGGMTLDGGSGNDRLSNSSTVTGGAGDDIITTADLATYSGDLADYAVSTDSLGVTTVKDLRSGSPDGIDTLANVPMLQFSDQTIFAPPPGLSAGLAPGPDTLTTAYSTAVATPVATLLANDTDSDGDVLSVTAVGGAQHGQVSLAGGVVTFTPFVGYVGAAGFTYTVDDGNGSTASVPVLVNVTGASPAYIYRAGITAGETIDTTGDNASHAIVTGSGDDSVFTGPGGSSVRLGAGTDVVFGGTGKDLVTFGPGLGTVTGGAGPDTFIFVKGQIADPATHGGQYDAVTDFTGAGSAYVAGRDFIYLKGFAHTATITYEHDLASDPTAHLYRVDDGAYHAEFVLDYAGPGMALSHSQYGFL